MEVLSIRRKTQAENQNGLRLVHEMSSLSQDGECTRIPLLLTIEALRDCWQSRTCEMDELWNYAKVCRMSRVMRPYLECLT